MTQENKKLLITDLCTRVTCGVEVLCISDSDHKWYNLKMVDIDDNEVYLDAYEPYTNRYAEIEDVKPYLFPLSSMTDELWDKEFRGYGITEFTRDSFKYGCETLDFNRSNPDLLNVVRFINQLIKNHFDIYGLISMGLAIDATDKNIY